jgi:hypothetical protein
MPETMLFDIALVILCCQALGLVEQGSSSCSRRNAFTRAKEIATAEEKEEMSTKPERTEVETKNALILLSLTQEFCAWVLSAV